uniref:phosphoribosylformylglycinamidine cyclo-ligase n=1 Tax=Ignisphaera aggregans TaxID=334771 RepID=A0A7C5TH31_9CREN
MGWTYSKAGVDLSKHRSMHCYVLELIDKLNNEIGYHVYGLGSYASTLKYRDLEISLHVDGVGTKTIVLQRLKKLRVAGWDCVAMNVNDVVCSGVKPIAIIDYITMPRADEETFKEIVEGVVDAAKVAGVAILGGETAILPDLVNGIDVVCTVFGIKKMDFVNKTNIGDVVVGISSLGLHANGYSLVRKILEEAKLDYNSIIEDIDLSIELANPVAIYSNLILEVIERNLITSAAHITGGAFTKLRRIISSNIDIVLTMPEPPKIFKLIMKLGNVPIEEMYRVFNMGIGMVLTANKNNVDALVSYIEKHRFRAYILGEVVKGSGRIVLKSFQGDIIIF